MNADGELVAHCLDGVESSRGHSAYKETNGSCTSFFGNPRAVAEMNGRSDALMSSAPIGDGVQAGECSSDGELSNDLDEESSEDSSDGELSNGAVEMNVSRESDDGSIDTHFASPGVDVNLIVDRGRHWSKSLRKRGHNRSRSRSKFLHRPSTDCEGIWHREVYVGNVPCGGRQLTYAFKDIFNELPAYRMNYSDLALPCTLRKKGLEGASSGDTTYFFLCFVDQVLASTAVALNGIKIAGKSLRIGRPLDAPPFETYSPPLDIEVLRTNGLLPHTNGAMQDQVWIDNVFSDTTQLEAVVSNSLLSLPSVKERFPDLGKVIEHVKITRCGTHAFVTLIHEVLASTLVAMRELRVDKWIRARVGWPNDIQNANERAPPSLHVPPIIEECTKPECEVHVGSQGLTMQNIHRVLEAVTLFFESLPSYKASHLGEDPISRVSSFGRQMKYLFVTMRHPILANTLVKVKTMKVGDQVINFGRPARFRPSAGECPTLEIQQTDNAHKKESLIDNVLQKRLASSATPMKANRLCLLPPPPPPPPLTRPVLPALPPAIKPTASLRAPRDSIDIWIGNLPECGAEAEVLERFLSDRALEAPGYDIEQGPPIDYVRVHHTKKFAFVHVKDKQTGEQLVPVFDNCKYFGHLIRAAIAWHHFVQPPTRWRQFARTRWFQDTVMSCEEGARDESLNTNCERRFAVRQIEQDEDDERSGKWGKMQPENESPPKHVEAAFASIDEEEL